MNIADNLVVEKKCDQALAIIDKELKNYSFLDSYVRMEYVNDLPVQVSQFAKVAGVVGAAAGASAFGFAAASAVVWTALPKSSANGSSGGRLGARKSARSLLPKELDEGD